MRELSVTILGFGGMGRARAAAYDNTTKYYGDCPIQPKRAQAFVLPNEANGAKALGWEVNLDLMDAIKNDKSEYIDICLPDSLHHSAALAAIEAKKHVFCEKPTVASARQ